MSNRQSSATDRALARYLAGESISAACRAEGIARSTLHRAINRQSAIEYAAMLKPTPLDIPLQDN